MEWIILEVLVVLALALGIVWWTTRVVRSREKDKAGDRGRPDQ